MGTEYICEGLLPGRWRLELYLPGPEHDRQGKCTGDTTDLSIGFFADDVAKLYVATKGETQRQLVELTIRESGRLADNMKKNGYHMNKDKAVSVPGLSGNGVYTTIKQAMRSSATYGEPAKDARYLGPQGSLYQLTSIEVTARIRHMKRTWVQLGAIWKKELPWQYVRVLICCFLQNTLFSGMLSFIPTDRQHHPMDVALARLLRYLMRVRMGKRVDCPVITTKEAFG